MNEEYLQHYGVKGMKWGVRRYVDRKGRLTPQGQARYDAFKKQESTRKELKSKVRSEGEKLFSKSKPLRKAMTSFDQVDDLEFLSVTASELKLNTKAFDKALSDLQSTPYDRKLAKDGRRIISKMK